MDRLEDSLEEELVQNTSPFKAQELDAPDAGIYNDVESLLLALFALAALQRRVRS